jgi:hypothetical protein
MFLYSLEHSTKTNDLNTRQALAAYRVFLIGLLKSLFPASSCTHQILSFKQSNDTNLLESVPLSCFSSNLKQQQHCLAVSQTHPRLDNECYSPIKGFPLHDRLVATFQLKATAGSIAHPLSI